MPWAIRYVLSGGLFMLPLVATSPVNRYTAKALLHQLRFPPGPHIVWMIYFVVLLTPHGLEALFSLRSLAARENRRKRPCLEANPMPLEYNQHRK